MISSFFIKRPIVAMAIAILTLMLGILTMTQLPLAQFPQIVPPQINISTTFTGADAITIEESVSTPIEQQMSGVDGLLYMQSTNANDGSEALSVTFDINTDPNIDQVNVQNRVSQALSSLPPDVSQFGVTLRKSVGSPVLLVSLFSPNNSYDSLFLANYNNINVVDTIFRVPGVGDVSVFGSAQYAMRIWVKPDVLAKLDISVSDIINAVRAQSTVNPSGQTGADPPPSGREMTYTVRAQGRLQTPEEFGQIVVVEKPDGSIVRLKDIARIELGGLTYRQRSRMGGQPSSTIAVYQAPGSNALAVAAGTKAAMADLKKRFPSDLDYAVTLDTTQAVTEGISENCEDADHRGDTGNSRRLHIPAKLARDFDTDDCGARVSHRHVCGLSISWFLDQHALSFCPRAGHRTGSGRCDRCCRSRRAPHRRRPASAGGDPPGDEGSVWSSGSDRVDSFIGVPAYRSDGWHRRKLE